MKEMGKLKRFFLGVAFAGWMLVICILIIGELGR